MIHSKLIFALIIGAVLWMSAATAEERLDLEGAKIYGSRELPKVLYVMPWQAASVGNDIKQSFPRHVHTDLSLLNREKFQRLLEFKILFKGRTQEYLFIDQ
ncbi:MAG: hypothetical protein ACE5EH_05240 [Gammaproteobacteria bacterium]